MNINLKYLSEKMDTRTKATIGSMEIVGDRVVLHGDSCGDGICYKDLNAWKNGNGIIYVGEYALQDYKNGHLALEELWTRDLWMDAVADFISDFHIGAENDMDFVAHIAETVLQECTWMDLGTGLGSWFEDLESEWADWCGHKPILYRCNKIVRHGERDVSYFMFNADCDIVEYRAKSVEDAKRGIDRIIENRRL